ncbi:hypothetical protein EDB84DRAFT_1442692 [Lactarius hengduanensis]|nr:hypothetical protein EDB84DRAFT_1442692 [Lactarius hengduanensis]
MALLDPPGSSISDLLLARARPNTRLVHSFGLQNTFVSADIVVRKQFITRAREGTSSTYPNFAAFPEDARGVVAGSALRLESPFYSGRHPAGRRTVVVVGAINDLWALSKKHRAAPPPSALLDSVNTYLRTWIPERYERPLDFVIPAYETMWRVVAVTVARAIHDRGACAAFSAFLESPFEDQFVRFENEQPQQPSVEAFICEVLRLHPPSGRLARAAPSRAGVLWAPVTTHVANIEALHQDTAIWGSDAGVFDPMRFHGSRLSYGQKHAFHPVQSRAAAVRAFKEAPRFAAIVAAVLEIVSAPDARYRLVCGERIGRREGWEGWSIEVRD